MGAVGVRQYAEPARSACLFNHLMPKMGVRIAPFPEGRWHRGDDDRTHEQT